jgi:NADPH-dependent 2,4-dienoyl-CoA reductase/sulfur reductase-like enzyme/predicted acylesterase/phospholipase RssA
MTSSIEFLLIGGGLASATAAETLRDEGSSGSILIVSSEPVVPYHRPPLSKEFLSDPVAVEKLLVKPPMHYRQREIQVALETRAMAVDPVARTVVTDRSGTLEFSKLLIATGADPMSLDVPGSDLGGIFHLRTLRQAEAVRSALVGVKHVLVVGASFLGMEVASTLSGKGRKVTIVERCPQVFPSLHAPEISAYFAELFRGRGGELIVDDDIVAFQGDQQVQFAVTGSGRTLPCDMVVVAVGVAPSVAFLQSSGLGLNNGILVDRYLRSSDPNIFAAGDVANFDDPVFRTRHRVEHWDNAIKQGRLAAKNMLGQKLAYDEVSYFFSECYDTSFEFIGSPEDTDEQIERGDLKSKSYARLYLKAGVPRALFSMGRPPQETRAVQSFIRFKVNLSAVKGQLSNTGFALEQIPSQTVLILQGGGAMGAFECGVVKAMEEAGIFSDVVAGVSIGALNGAIVASHPGHAAPVLEAFWRELMVDTPVWPAPAGIAAALTSWQIVAYGVPKFFRPRWTSPSLAPQTWTSFYDPAPVKELLTKYVDFANLKASPVRLLVSAVNVESGLLEIFDSYVDDLTADHVIASGSLPPGFPWTTIDGKHYWDGGIISNSPLDLVIERCGESGKRVFIVDLFSAMRPLPKNLMEVQARRDEIVYSERVRNDVANRERVQDYRQLIEELTSMLKPSAAARVKERPLYIQLMGDVAPITITRFVRAGAAGESAARDYDFSRPSIERNKSEGYDSARKKLQSLGGGAK